MEGATQRDRLSRWRRYFGRAPMFTDSDRFPEFVVSEAGRILCALIVTLGYQ